MGVAKVILNEEVLIDVTQKTVSSQSLLSGETALGADGEDVIGSLLPQGEYQSKTVTPTKQTQTIIPDQGYDAMSQVTVNPIPNDYIIPTGLLSIVSPGITYVSEYEAVNVPTALFDPVGLNSVVSSTGTDPFFKVVARTTIGTDGFISSAIYENAMSVSGFIPEMSYTPSTGAQILSTSGKYMFGSVRINATPLTSISVTPTLSDQVLTPTSPNIGFSKVTVSRARVSALTVSFSESMQTLDPSSPWIGFSRVVVPPVKLQSKFAGFTSSLSSFQVTPDSGYTGLSLVTVFPPNVAGITVTPASIPQQIHPSNGDLAFSFVNVNAIPSEYVIPTGIISIFDNGVYDIKNYASVDVSVSGSGNGLLHDVLMRTISVGFEDSEVTSIPSYFFSACRALQYISAELCTNIAAYAFANCNALSSVYLPNCTTLGDYAFSNVDYVTDYSFPMLSNCGAYEFNGNDRLKTFYAPNLSRMPIGMFQNCTTLQTVTFSTQLSGGIRYMAFYNCYNLLSINLNGATSVDSSAFYSCSALSSVGNTGSISAIGSGAFQNCSALHSFDFTKCERIYPSAFREGDLVGSLSLPVCSSIGGYAFAYCSNITGIYAPSLSDVGSCAFYFCSKLVSIDLAICSIVWSQAFGYCSLLSDINTPNMKTIYSGGFLNCSRLSRVRFDNLQSLGGSAFARCSALESVYLLSTARVYMAYVNTSSMTAFYSTPILDSSYLGHYGSIYIRASLYDLYLSSAAWATYSERLVGLTDSEIENLPF